MGVCITIPASILRNEATSPDRISYQPLNPSEGPGGSAGECDGKFSACIRREETCSSEDVIEMSKTSLTLWETLSKTEYADFFRTHPELLKSSSAAVMCTGVFRPGEVVGAYQVVKELPAGTVGRGFLVREAGAAVPEAPEDIINPDGRQFVFKVVNFVNRRNLLEPVLEESKTLMGLSSEGLVRPVNLLLDEGNGTIIAVTPFFEGGSCAALAGEVGEERLLSILRDVAAALRVLHSHNIYHYNLKLENVLLGKDGKACVTDAALWRIFSAQSRDCLLFNGELACMPPETLLAKEERDEPIDLRKVDIWGLGLFMYRLAYGTEPYDTDGKTLEETCQLVSVERLKFPKRNWNIANSLEDAIRLCLDDDPERRPTISGLFGFSLFRNYSFDCAPPTATRVHHNDRPLSAARPGPDNYIRWAFPRYHWRKDILVDEMLGSGGICDTYRVHMRHCPSKELAMKVLKRSVLKIAPRYGIDKDSLLRALAFSQRISHPNILGLLEIVDSSDGCFATQQLITQKFVYVEFPPLVNNAKPLFTVKRMLFDVLRGLFALHINGVPHLRLTPSNVFFEPNIGFRICDFGPLFITREEIVESVTTGEPLYSAPQWVVDDLRLPLHESNFSLDVFCVGLLAASALPSVLHEEWYRFCNAAEDRFDVKKVCEMVKSASLYLKPALTDFVLLALNGPTTTIRDLLDHPYFSDMAEFNKRDGLRPLNILPTDMTTTIAERFTATDESRLWSVLGHDPTIGNGHLCSMFRRGTKFGDDTRCGDNSLSDIEVLKKVNFVKRFTCGLCRCELPIVVFLCDKCVGYIRCGKCSLVDTHADGHKLTPHIIHTVERRADQNFVALLMPTCNICVAQSLEALEMQANLPHGTLTKSVAAQFVTAERATRRRTLAKLNSGHKVLPKISDIEGETWEEEVESCRSTRNTELLLHQFELTAVPNELFDPPLLHVTTIDVSHNRLTSLPNDLAVLSNLRSISVSHNRLTVLPDSLGDLRQLDHIDASHNLLRDLPSTFLNLRELSTTALDFNRFSRLPSVLDDLIVATASMPRLSIIYLAENTDITEFPDYTNLAILPTLKLALDNEPNVYRTYLSKNLEENLPNVSMLWNKIYPDRIVDDVFCGSLRTTQSQFVYDKLGIKNLLTVGRDLVPVPPVGGKHLVISLDDIEEADIRCTFEEAVSFIDMSVKAGEGCLVHCFAGLSRSATTVIAYLMMKRSMRIDDAYRLTRRGRPSIYPNEGFFRQMIELDRELFPDGEPPQLGDLGRGSPNRDS